MGAHRRQDQGHHREGRAGAQKKLRQISVNLLNGETEAAGLEGKDHHYRQIRTFKGRLVTQELGEAWFNTARVAAVNVVQLEFAQA